MLTITCLLRHAERGRPGAVTSRFNSPKLQPCKLCLLHRACPATWTRRNLFSDVSESISRCSLLCTTSYFTSLPAQRACRRESENGNPPLSSSFMEKVIQTHVILEFLPSAPPPSAPTQICSSNAHLCHSDGCASTQTCKSAVKRADLGCGRGSVEARA